MSRNLFSKYPALIKSKTIKSINTVFYYIKNVRRTRLKKCRICLKLIHLENKEIVTEIRRLHTLILYVLVDLMTKVF